MTNSTRLILTAPMLLALAPFSAAAQTAPASPAPNDYADASSWLCRPDRDDSCAVDLASTVVAADGTMSAEAWTPNPSAPIDCFYVYPTVSTDRSAHSDMSPDAAELRVVHQQFARFATVCRPYAPSYRQVTIAALMTGMSGGSLPALDAGLGFADVRDAFRSYLENDNDGRGFVLIGHSQGAYVLSELIRQEIDGTPLQNQLVSAILLGATVTVEDGRDVGGSFEHVPLCRSVGQTGCVVTYASFRQTAPPPPSTLFGRASESGEVGACTNPVSLSASGSGLHSYLSADGSMIAGSAGAPTAWVEGGAAIETPFVSVPGLLTAACATNENATYLEIGIDGDQGDPRVDDIPGDITPPWGLHLIDVNLAMGNLIDIVRTQAGAFGAR